MIEAAAFFGVKSYKGATRWHNNKLRKTLPGYGQEVPSARSSNRPASKAVPIPYSLRERKFCSRCNKLTKHRATECRSPRPSANKASITKGIKSSKDLNNASRKVTTAIFLTITNGDDASDEESRYPTLGTKAIKDGHTYANNNSVMTRNNNSAGNDISQSNTNNITSYTNINSTGTSSINVNQTIGTTTNPMQANIRSRMTDFLITTNADDDVSSISSEDSIDINYPLPTVEQPI